MILMRKLFTPRNVELAFAISLVFKGIFALAEIASGLVFEFVPRQSLLELAQAVTRMELSEDPRDFVANYLLHAAQGLSAGTQRFTALYLLGHGAVKLWLIVGLWRRKLGYYPAAIAVFGFFILYQLYRYSFTHALSLLFVTAVDVAVVGLTVLEYRRLRRRTAAGRA